MLVSPTIQNEINAHIDLQCTESAAYKYSQDQTPIVGLPLEPVPKSRKSRGMTYEKLHKQIMLGYGQGHAASYQPWLQIRRKNPSPRSNQVVTWLPPLERTAHFFSRGEYHTALLLLWLEVTDVREQYPIWPVPHPHPLDGVIHISSGNLLWSRGLIAIAKEAGIDHGREIGTRLPYVATMDFVVTVPLQSGPSLFTFSSKPLLHPDEEVGWRTLERLELERRYASEIKARYAVLSSSLVPLRVAGHLEWWLDCSTLAECGAMSDQADRFAEFVERQTDLSLAESVKKAAIDFRLELSHAWILFRYCAWTQKIDIDPSKPILTSYPISTGGRSLRASLRQDWFGESWG